MRGEDWNFQFSGKIEDGILHFRLQMQYEGDDSEQARTCQPHCGQLPALTHAGRALHFRACTVVLQTALQKQQPQQQQQQARSLQPST